MAVDDQLRSKSVRVAIYMVLQDQSTQAIIELIKSVKLQHSTEFLMQGDLYELFHSLGIPFEKEYQLSKTSTVDLFINGVAIECKVKGQPIQIHRQLERYALHDEVKAIILVTAKFMNVKPIINGKPAFCIHIGKSWSL